MNISKLFILLCVCLGLVACGGGGSIGEEAQSQQITNTVNENGNEEVEEILSSLKNFDQAVIDDIMAIPVPARVGAYDSGGENYGRNSPAMLVLTLLGIDDPERTSSNGVNILDRAVAHMRNSLSPLSYPEYEGGAQAWYDMYIPIVIGIMRHEPEIWEQLNGSRA